ncbi:AAA family ATPase [Cellulosimicrobium funkei]|nr:AAA family ATPase [Cellulosimicrobium funkei]
MTASIERAVREQRVTVVTAPSGYGKTTAMAEWAAQQNRRTVWFSGMTEVEDSTALFTGIMTGLGERADAEPTTEQSPLPRSPRGVKTMHRRICETVQGLDSGLVLVVDDAHQAGNELTQGLLGMMAAAAPEQLKLVLVGTPALEAILAKQIITAPEARLGVHDLAFDLPEIQLLLERFETPLDAREVLDYTQGWPIAVRMAAIGGRRLSSSDDDLDNVLQDYIHDHILTALPGPLATVALTTTVCTELSVELASALTGKANAGEYLDALAQQGIFLRRYFGPDDVPLYRWHTLFARQCTRILARQDAGALRSLHHRAGDYLQVSDPLAALHHFMSAQDHDRVVSSLMNCWLGLTMGNHADDVAAICAGLPEGVSAKPVVQVIWACAEAALGEHHVARSRFEHTLDSVQSDEIDDSLKSVLRLGRLYLSRDLNEALEASQEVRASLSARKGWKGTERASVLYLLAWTELQWRLHPDTAPEMLSAAAREWGGLGDSQLERNALSSLALVNVWAGRNRQAREILRSLSIPAGADGTAGTADRESTRRRDSAISTSSGLLAYWSADYDEASSAIKHALEAGDAPVPFGGALRMLLAFSAAGSRDQIWCRRAAAELQAIPRTAVQGTEWPVFREAAKAVLEEAAGHRTRAVALVQRLPDVSNLPMVGVVMAGILRRAGDPLAAFRLLSKHHEFMDVPYVAVSTRITAALVHRLRGEPEIAHEYCEYALDIASREDLRQPFCDEDLNLRLLLSDHLTRKTAHEAFITECLTVVRTSGVLSALSDREVDVFRLLQTSKTIREIAVDLLVSVNTVKTHQRSIYRKLGVQSRREAQRVAP